MLNSVLWLAVVTAIVCGLAAIVMTQSLLWGFVAYAGAGMAVLFSLLIVEMLFGDARLASELDDERLSADPRS